MDIYFIILFVFLQLHDHPTYLVDAMWDTHNMLKDWHCMTQLLLNNNVNNKNNNSVTLDDQQERFLVEIIHCCVKQAATGEYPIARRTANRKVSFF